MRHQIHLLLHSEALFWPAWVFLTVAAAVGTAWFCRSAAARVPAGQGGLREAPFGRPGTWSGTSLIAVAVLTLFLGVYAATILVGEDFAMNDDSQLTLYSLRGVNLPKPIAPSGGRFWPLGLQEFNLIGRFTKTIAGYHAFAIGELALLALVLVNLDNQLKIGPRVTLTILALITPGVAISYTGLTFPERNVLLLLACLALFVRLFDQTHSAWYAVAAVVSAQAMLYLKEPVSLMLLGFAAARWGLRGWSASGQWSFRRLGDEDSRLDLSIAAVSLVFLAFYALMMFPYTSAEYLAFRHLSLAETVRYYLKVDLPAWTLAVAAVVRMYRIVRGSVAPLLLWDGLAWGGLVYFGAYLGLGMASPYYLAPVELIAVIYLGHLLVTAWGKLGSGSRVLAAALAAVVMGQSLEQSTFQVLERKYIIHQKLAIARLILETYQREPGSVLTLYFPFTNEWVLSEFAAYLRYRGLPVEERGGEPAPAGRVRISGGKIASDGPCVYSGIFVCHAGGAETARLTIVLPEDGATAGEMELYRASEERLHAEDSRTRPPGWLFRTLLFLGNHGAG